MRRMMFRLLLACAFVCAGAAAQLHGLAHARHDVAKQVPAAACGGESTPQAEHSSEQCLVVHAFDAAGPAITARQSFERVALQPAIPACSPRRDATTVAFRSRAPPLPA